MTIHARFSPSKLERILACPASVGLSDHAPPQATSGYAEEGTLLHELTAEMLELWPEHNLDAVNWETPEHKFLVSQCLDKVKELVERFQYYKIYQNLDVTMGNQEVKGTLDIGITGTTVENQFEIHIIDLKFGAGVTVFADNNPQLLAYLDGFCNQIIGPNYIDHLAAFKVKCYVHIFQPRKDHFWFDPIFADELLYFKERVDKTIRLANATHPPFHPGAKQCQWCPAGAVCKARMNRAAQQAIEILDAHADVVIWNEKMADVKELGKLLAYKSFINSALDDIHHFLFTKLKMGEQVPGYKLVAGRSKRQWQDGVDAFTLNDMFPQLDTTDLVEAKLKSPAQVEKLLNSKERVVLNEVIDKIEGEPTMAPESSLKEELDINLYDKSDKAKRVFKNLIGD